jgi:CRISPR-associated protein Csm3
MYSRIIISYELECMSGLRIGGGNTSLDIGGIDSPVIKDSFSKLPYIPGSSIKGKMRSLYEWFEHHDKILKNGGKVVNDPTTDVGKVFGTANINAKPSDGDIYQTRAIFTNAYLANREELEKHLGRGVYTEIKPENTIDRLTSRANPRFFEQVPRGAIFKGGIILTVFKPEEREEIIRVIKTSMKLLEDSYLGGGGTRGSGQVKFINVVAVERKKEYYTANGTEEVVELFENA